jgi:Fic family protein
MVYIYVKHVGGKNYYYLRLSKRVNGKLVVKDVAYLGDDLSKMEQIIDSLEKKYRDQIRKSYKTIKRFLDSNIYLEKIKKMKIKSIPYLEADELEQIEALKLHFNNHFLKLDRETIRNTYKNFLVEFAYNTTSIEGNTITLKEANKLLREDLTPNERSPREIFDLQNTQKVFFYLIENEFDLSHELIIDIHDKLMENIDARKGYRTHDIRVFKSHFDASPAKYVKTDMDILIKWYKQHKGRIHPLALAGMLHQKFEKIHPFSDGNGRTGRMLMVYMLLKEGFPPIIIQKKNRADYLRVLAIADKSNPSSIEPEHFKGLIKYLAGEYMESYWNTFNV